MAETESVEKSVERYFDHFARALEMYENIESIGEYNAIGMGGSGIAGKFFEDMGYVKSISCYFSKDLEKNLQKENNVIISYSGNTKETLSWIESGTIKKYVALTSGGKLEKLALNTGNYLVKLPGGMQPRASFPYMLVALAKLHSKETYEKIKADVENAKKRKDKLRREAEKISEELEGPILVYGDCISKTIAYRAKTQLNENAKELALFNQIPEALHNEVEALKKFKGSILIIAGEEHSRNIIKGMKEVFNDKKILSYFVSKNMIEAVYFVDMLSIFYGKKTGVKDLDSVDTIKRLKVKVNE